MCRGAHVCQAQAHPATSNRPIFSSLTCASHSLLDQSLPHHLACIQTAQAPVAYIQQASAKRIHASLCFISRRPISTSKCSNLDVRHRRPATLFRRLLFPATLECQKCVVPETPAHNSFWRSSLFIHSTTLDGLESFTSDSPTAPSPLFVSFLLPGCFFSGCSRCPSASAFPHLVVHSFLFVASLLLL